MNVRVKHPAVETAFPADPYGVDPLIPTLFHEKWWLDIFTEGHYDHAEVSKGGKIVGRLLYFNGSKKYGMSASRAPHMIHFLGPAVDEGDGTIEKRAVERHQITSQLIKQLPKFDIISYKCHRDITNTAAFQEHEFQTKVQFTLEIHPRPLDDIWNGMSKKKRSQIRRAQNVLHLSKIDNANEFASFYVSNLRDRQIKNTYDMEKIKRAIRESAQNQRGAVFGASNSSGVLNAAIFCAWDKTSAYYLMCSRTEDAHDGAISMLLWEAIQAACGRGLIFDFDGLSTKGSFDFFAGFGAAVRPRYIVTRYSSFARIAYGLKSALIPEYCFY